MKKSLQNSFEFTLIIINLTPKQPKLTNHNACKFLELLITEVIF